MSGSAMEALAAAAGILPEWHDISGNHQVTRPETRQALLQAMGITVAGEAEAAEALAALHTADAARRLPGEMVVDAGDDLRLPLGGDGAADWRLELEDGTVQEGCADAAIVMQPPPGLHRLVLDTEHCLVIVAPRRAPGVADVLGSGRKGGARAWGVTAALYGLRSRRDLGLGDYADLADAAAALGSLGADFIGINPVHARGAAAPGISPYTPSCRTAFEPRHIAVDAVPGFADCESVQALVQAERQRLATAGEAALIDYGAAEALSGTALRALFQAFEQRAGAEVDSFAAWRRSEGAPLEWFAVFEAISLRHGADWQAWPAALRRPDSRAVRKFAAAHAGEVRYHAWLQWLAHRQLAAAQQRARTAGMGLGLYLDVAVGVRPGGADTWAFPGCFAAGVSLGAPPDAFNPGGQNWALAPFSPVGLREAGYHPFIEMLRAAMRHAGIIRIDHILGVNRSFWVPQDGVPGGYVSYPQEALLALIRLEAWRAGCVVVGEDLGSVPPGLRDRLAEAGLYGCAVLQFEKHDDHFRPPRDYRPATLASFATHDTPTLRGWWSGWDIDRRHDINGGDAAARDAEHAGRAAERRGLARLLRDEGLAPPGLDPAAPPPEADDALALSLHRLLASASSALVAVQLDDALGRVEQQNLPGTVDEHPNWRRRYAVGVEALAEHPGLRSVAGLFSPPQPPSHTSRETKPWQ